MDHYQTQAEAAVKCRDYKSALDFCNKAIVRAESVKLYDKRAACHEALNDLPAALKDAKKCIRDAPIDPVGYIRAARILVKMDRKSTAVEAMAYGLKKVKHAGQSYETLRKMHNDLMEDISPRTYRDPLKMLPPEIAHMVLDYLSFKQLVRVRSTSRGWNQFICSQEKLWTHLDLSEARKKVSYSFVVAAIKSAKRRITHATLHKLFDFDKVVQVLIANCPIESIKLGEVPALGAQFEFSLNRAKQLRHLDTGTQPLSTHTLASVLRPIHERLERFHSTEMTQSAARRVYESVVFPKLKELHRHNAGAWGLAQGDGISNMPMLETLVLVQSSGGMLDDYRLPSGALLHLQRLDLTFTQSFVLDQVLGTLPQHLRSLRLIGKGSFLRPILPSMWELMALPHLKELELRPGPGTVPILSAALLSNDQQCHAHSRLRRLVCSYAPPNDSSLLQDLKELCTHPRLQALEHFALLDTNALHDEAVPVIVQHLQCLTSLDLSESSITGVGVVEALKLPRLRELRIDLCQGVSPDAVQLARSKGITVHTAKADALQYERKIRS